MPGPLEGILVVSLEQAVAAPFASRQLGDLGARVIKVERDSGDFARAYDDKVGGEASYFVWLNRNKESVVLDLKAAGGLDALHRLLERADVFIQNLAPGAAARLGIDGPTLLERHPRLIHASISGYGSGGPAEQKKAYDLLVQCEAGLLSVTGTPDEVVKAGISIADIAAGMYTYSGVLAALLQRGRTGRGQILEVSMLEALGEWMQQPYLYARYGGSQQSRTGAEHATIAPYGPFETSEGRVFFGLQNEREWQTFCTAVVRSPELAADVRFGSNAARVAHRVELREAIEDVTRTLTTRGLTERLDAAGIANAVLRDMAGFAAHPQLLARESWHAVDTPSGTVEVLTPPVRFDEIEYRWDAVPSLGEHTEAVRSELA